MTTAVKVDAHAGWPVLVVTKVGEPTSAKSINTDRVEPYTERTFYLHSGLEIVSIQECTEGYVKKPDAE